MANLFDELTAAASNGKEAAIDQLVASLKDGGDYHRAFEALMMKTRLQMGLPLSQPISFDNVPDDRTEEFEKNYVNAAREVGQLLLDANRIGEAWQYFRTIREPGPVRDSLEKIKPGSEPDDGTEELINLALYEGAHPVKGLEIMLRSNGTCNTVTAMDQVQHELDAADRAAAAELLADQVYEELTNSLTTDVQQRMAFAAVGNTVRELIAGREWLFAEGNYHIDVSHLNAVVRFSRALDKSSPSLAKAIELAEYGSNLDAQLQYGGDPPFDDFYVASRHFLRVVAGENVEEGVAYFRAQLDEEPDAEDKPPLAMVVIDLLTRSDRIDEAVALAAEYADGLEAFEFSIAKFCADHNRFDQLEDIARSRGDVIGFTSALLSK